MRITMGARIALIVLAAVVGLAAFVVFSFEREYGGQHALTGLSLGYLPDGSVEVREVDWGLGPEATGDYEIAADDGTVAVRLVDSGGRVLFTGSEDQVAAWLDEQGPRRYLGSMMGAIGFQDEVAEGASNYTPAAVLAIIAVVLLGLALLPSRQRRTSIGKPVTTS